MQKCSSLVYVDLELHNAYAITTGQLGNTCSGLLLVCHSPHAPGQAQAQLLRLVV